MSVSGGCHTPAAASPFASKFKDVDRAQERKKDSFSRAFPTVFACPFVPVFLSFFTRLKREKGGGREGIRAPLISPKSH